MKAAIEELTGALHRINELIAINASSREPQWLVNEERRREEITRALRVLRTVESGNYPMPLPQYPWMLI